jgi:hypothetical protein
MMVDALELRTRISVSSLDESSTLISVPFDEPSSISTLEVPVPLMVEECNDVSSDVDYEHVSLLSSISFLLRILS